MLLISGIYVFLNPDMSESPLNNEFFIDNIKIFRVKNILRNNSKIIFYDEAQLTLGSLRNILVIDQFEQSLILHLSMLCFWQLRQMKIKEELAPNSIKFPKSESEPFDQSNQFVSATQNVLQKCKYFYQLVENFSSRAKNDVRNMEHKAQTIMANFQGKLESYMKMDNFTLMQRDQSQFIVHNLDVINQIGDQVQQLIEKISLFGDQLKGINQRSVKKGAIKPLQQVNINIPRNDKSVEFKFQSTFLKQLESSQYLKNLASSGPYFTISESENSSELYKIDNSNQIAHILSLPFEVKLLAATDDNRIAINELIYNLNDMTQQQSIQQPIEKYICVFHTRNILYYGHINYPFIFRVDQQLKQITLRPNLGFNKGPGVDQIEEVRGLQDQLLFLYKGIVRKFTVMPENKVQLCETVFQATADIVKFQVLPDNIHLVAITKNGQLFTADHFTGNILQKIETQSQLSSIYIHPHFDFEQYPVIIGSSTTQVFAIDALNSGITFGNSINGAQLKAKVDDYRYIIQVGSKLMLIQIY